MHRIAGVLFLATFIAGCGLTSQQRDAVIQFGQAAQSTGDFAAGQIPKLRDAVIAMNVVDVEIGGTRKPGELDRNVDAQTIAIRVRAANALASYGRLLVALVTETQADQLKQASDDFVASFRSVSGNHLSDTQLDALGNVVNEAGGWLIEYKKAKATKAIVPQAAPEVDNLCDLLIADFDPTGLHLSHEVNVARNQLRGHISIALAKGGSFAERAAAVHGESLAKDAEAQLKLVNAQAIEALRALKTANKNVVEALNEQQFDPAAIDNLATQVNILATAIRTLAAQQPGA